MRHEPVRYLPQIEKKSTAPEYQIKLREKKLRGCNRKTKFNVMFCPGCGQAYEVIYRCGYRGKDAIATVYHENFPTFGLERKLCGGCK